MTIRVDFACNDPDSGAFLGRVQMIHWRAARGMRGYEGLDLMANCASFDGPKFTDDAKHCRVRILRKWFPYLRTKNWIGNWCWDGFEFDPPVAKALLRHLRASRMFAFDCGPERLSEWWDTPKNSDDQKNRAA